MIYLNNLVSIKHEENSNKMVINGNIEDSY